MIKRPPELRDVFKAFNNRDWKQYGSPQDYDGIIWNDQPTLTREQVETKLAELQAEYDAEQYARDRKKEYPDVIECVHALLDGGDTLTDLQAKRTTIKDKYPKS